MNLDKGRISGTQFMLAITCFIHSSALLTTFLADVTFQDSWMVVLIGGVICLPLIWLYRTLMILFPEQNLMQMLETVYGTVLGKIIGVMYLWFFFTLSALNMADLAEFSKMTIMDKTPHTILMLVCVLVAAFAVKNGIKLVTRFCTIFLVASFIILILSIVLGHRLINFDNFLPMFDQPMKSYLQGVHIIITIPFGELVIFLMLTPNVKLPPKDLTRYMFLAFGIGAISPILVMFRDIAILGNLIDLFTIPSLITLRLFNTGITLGRIELLFTVVLIMLLFYKISVLYYVTVLGVAQLMNLKSYRHIVLSAGMLMIYYGVSLYNDPVGHIISGQKIASVAWLPFEIFIPILTLIVAKVRGLPKTGTLPQPQPQPEGA